MICEIQIYGAAEGKADAMKARVKNEALKTAAGAEGLLLKHRSISVLSPAVAGLLLA